MKQDHRNYIGKDNNFIYILFALGIFFLIFNTLGKFSALRDSISYVFEPITNSANNIGSSMNEYFSTFVKLGDFMKEYNSMKITLNEKDAEYSNYLALKSENEALKKQLTLADTKSTFAMANVLRDDDVNSLLIDMGSSSGIKQGNVVVLGNTFIGIITSTDTKGSRIRLATDSNSHLEVAIMKEGTESKKNILSNGVIVGSTEGIRIENIAMNSDVVNGDVVYVNDAKIGGFWTLGYVVGLSNNPASTYKTAYVSPALDYDDLVKVFVKLD